MDKNKSKTSVITKSRTEAIFSLSDFKEFHSDDREWDNIPAVIPHFIVFLEKHVKELAKVCTNYTDSKVVTRLENL